MTRAPLKKQESRERSNTIHLSGPFVCVYISAQAPSSPARAFQPARESLLQEIFNPKMQLIIMTANTFIADQYRIVSKNRG